MTNKIVAFDKLEDMPDSWEWVPLGELMVEPKVDIVDGPFGSNLKASEYTDTGIHIARLQNIDRNLFVYKNIRYISSEKAEQLDRHNFKPGDILITKLGAPLGKACIAPKKILHGVIVADLVRVRIRNNNITREYLTYAINSPFLVKQFERHTKGTTRPRVNLGVIRKLPIPVAPQNEQKRIVAEIEKQFSRLDEAVENLKRVKTNLKRYKSSVLKAAVEGKLTEEWRKSNPDIEPAEKLLERILVERRKKWEEAELAKMETKEAVPKDDKWKKKYNEPKKPSEFYLDLPTRWIEVRAEQICDFITKGTTPKANKLYSNKGEIPFIKVYNLTNTGRLDFSKKPTFISNDTNENELTRSRVYPGDVLMNIVGPPLGKVSVIPNSFGEGNINQAIAIFRAMPSYNNLLLSYFLLSDNILSWAERRAKATAGQFNLTLEICRNLPIPVPPAEEQITIFTILEQLFTRIDELNNIIDKNLKRAERLRQSILKKAFNGKLIPQSNNDESVENSLKQSA